MLKVGPWILAMFVALLMAFEARAGSAYRISPGDVLELSVIGVPELHYKSTVTMEGVAFFPLIGDLMAQGRSLGDLRDELRVKLSKKVAPRANGSGVDDTVAFSAEQINLVIAEYRPVYVTGDVSHPGEQRYRIGMTAREAIAVAGGQLRGSSQAEHTSTTQAEYGVTLNNLAREQIQLLRLRAEYEGATSLDEIARSLPEGTAILPRSSAILALEAERFNMDIAAQAREKAHLKDVSELTSRHLSLLSERRAKEAEALKEDQADLDRVNALFRSGVTVTGRVTEARRALLFSATQLLQTDTSIAAVERDALGLKIDSIRLEGKRRQDLAAAIQDSMVKIQDFQTRLADLAQRVVLDALPVKDAAKDEPIVVSIYRRQENGKPRLTAEPDSELLPGDVVEVSVPGLILEPVPARSRD